MVGNSIPTNQRYASCIRLVLCCSLLPRLAQLRPTRSASRASVWCSSASSHPTLLTRSGLYGLRCCHCSAAAPLAAQADVLPLAALVSTGVCAISVRLSVLFTRSCSRSGCAAQFSLCVLFSPTGRSRMLPTSLAACAPYTACSLQHTAHRIHPR